MYSGQVLRGAVGRPIPDLLETLRQEYENMGQEISVFKAQRDEYERKRRHPAIRLPPRAAPRRPPRRPPRLLALPARGAQAPAPCPPPWKRGGGISGGLPAAAVAGPRVPASAVCEGWGFRRRCPTRKYFKWGGRCIVFGIPAAGCSTPCSGCGRSDRLRLGGSGGAAAGNDRDERDA
jgi:hypothetical protein